MCVYQLHFSCLHFFRARVCAAFFLLLLLLHSLMRLHSLLRNQSSFCKGVHMNPTKCSIIRKTTHDIANSGFVGTHIQLLLHTIHSFCANQQQSNIFEKKKTFRQLFHMKWNQQQQRQRLNNYSCSSCSFCSLVWLTVYCKLFMWLLFFLHRAWCVCVCEFDHDLLLTFDLFTIVSIPDFSRCAIGTQKIQIAFIALVIAICHGDEKL